MPRRTGRGRSGSGPDSASTGTAAADAFQKIPCMYCQTVLEIMWGIQHQMRKLVHQEKSELTKEDHLHSQGLKKFLSRNGFDVKPEMVNEKIVAAAGALFDCQSWDMLKLAIAVKVICCPEEQLTDFHEVLAEDELSKLKADALKYRGITGQSNWLRTCKAAVSTYHLRIAKKKLLRSLVKEAYEAEEKHVRRLSCRESPEKIPQAHVVFLANRCSSGLPPRPPSFCTTASASNPCTCLAGDPSICSSGDEDTPQKRRKYCGGPRPSAMDSRNAGQSGAAPTSAQDEAP